MDGGQRGRPPSGPSLLPDELLCEIFTRLSAKTLSKIRCVSKSWLSIISSQEFVKSHFKKWDNDDEFTHHSIIAKYINPHLHVKQCSVYSLLRNPATPAARIDYPGENPPHSTSVVGSCNGLICILLDEQDLYLWNPCTRQFRKLSDPGFSGNSRSFNFYGFGYNESNNDYNVVLGSISSVERKIEVVIYSLKTDSWSMIDNFPTCLPWLETGAFVSGKLHWAVSSCVCDCDARVVSLDLVRLEYGEVRLPGCVEDASVLTLGVLGKCLCVSILYCYQPNVIWKKNVGLWVMMEYGVVESWIKVASVRPYHAPLCISAKGEILLTSSSDFGLYNLGDESMRYPRIEDVDDVYLEGHIYVESLVSPFADEERLHDQQR